jgi:hypothetical protein
MENNCELKSEQMPLKERMKTWSFWKLWVSLAVGALAGYLYYYFVGCASGTCAITSNPYASMFFGAFFGYYLINRPCSTC